MNTSQKSHFLATYAAITAASAMTLLEHTSPFTRNRKAMNAMIQAVREAAVPFIAESNIPDHNAPPRHLENPLHRLAPPESFGIANGFLFGYVTKQQAVREVIEQYGLYKSGLAALSMTEQGDSKEAIIVLLNIVHTLKAGRVGKRNRVVASQSRSHQRSFIKQIILDEFLNVGKGQKKSRDLWFAAGQAVNYEFEFNRNTFKCDATINNNKLCGTYFNASCEDGDVEDFPPINYEQFKNLVGKLKMEISEGA